MTLKHFTAESTMAYTMSKTLQVPLFISFRALGMNLPEDVDMSKMAWIQKPKGILLPLIS